MSCRIQNVDEVSRWRKASEFDKTMRAGCGVEYLVHNGLTLLCGGEWKWGSRSCSVF